MDGKTHMMMEPVQFEERFLKHMISHHASAIREADDCLEEAYHGELLSLCQNVISTQSPELGVMQGWLCEWYEACDFRHNL
jgi:uncharacterized protein (DUF305 family)